MDSKKSELKLTLDSLGLVKEIFFKLGVVIILLIVAIYLQIQDYSVKNLIDKTQFYLTNYSQLEASSVEFNALSTTKQKSDDLLNRLQALKSQNKDKIDLADFVGYFGKTLKDEKSLKVIDYSLGNLDKGNTFTALDSKNGDISTKPQYNAVTIKVEGTGVDIQGLMNQLEKFDYKYSGMELINKDTSSSLSFIIDLR